MKKNWRRKLSPLMLYVLYMLWTIRSRLKKLVSTLTRCHRGSITQWFLRIKKDLFCSLHCVCYYYRYNSGNDRIDSFQIRCITEGKIQSFYDFQQIFGFDSVCTFSFQATSVWLPLIRQIRGSKSDSCPIIFVGNKSDEAGPSRHMENVCNHILSFWRKLLNSLLS